MHENNYQTYDLELTIVVFALYIMCHYLYEVSFQLFTNRTSLKYIFTQKELNIVNGEGWSSY